MWGWTTRDPWHQHVPPLSLKSLKQSFSVILQNKGEAAVTVSEQCEVIWVHMAPGILQRKAECFAGHDLEPSLSILARHVSFTDCLFVLDQNRREQKKRSVKSNVIVFLLGLCVSCFCVTSTAQNCFIMWKRSVLFSVLFVSYFRKWNLYYIDLLHMLSRDRSPGCFDSNLQLFLPLNCLSVW